MIGSVISLTMILFRRREWAANIPFGPYLAAGSIVWLFAGHRLLAWFISVSGHGPPTTIEM
jgi:leader peptidase (prepilin peptidase)/N-methyltransferase